MMRSFGPRAAGPRATGLRGHFLRRMARRAVRCSGCGRRYRLDRMRFLAHQGDAWLYLATCTRCRSRALVGVVARGTEPAPCDATAGEQARFAALPPVGHDEVMAMRRRLERFDGDFTALFRQTPAVDL